MRLLRPLRHRPVALLWGGLALSAIGDQLYNVALIWIAVGALGAAAAYVTALQAACMLVTTLFAGHWVDRWEQRPTLIAADLARIAALLLVVALWSVKGQPSPAALVFAVVVLATGAAIARPAVQALLPTLLPDRAALPAANALIDSTERMARLAGPMLVGALAGLLPERHFLTLDAATFAASAIAVLLIGRRSASPAAPPATSLPGIPPARMRFSASALRGVRAVRHDGLLRDCWATSGVLNGAWLTVFYLCVPLLIQREGLGGPAGTGLGAFGLVIACYGLTNFLTLLVVGNREMPARPQTQIALARFVMGAGLLVVAAAAAFAPHGLVLAGMMAGALVAAPGGPMGDVPIAVMRQLRTPPGEVAPAVRAFIASSQLGTILALLVAPVLIAWLGVASVAALCGVMVMMVGVLIQVRNAGGAYQ